MKNIIIGNKKNNVFYLLRKSWAARLLLAGNMVCVYLVYGSVMRWDIRTCMTVLALGLLSLNLIYMPLRFMGEKSVGKADKHLFTVIVAVTGILCMVNMERLNIINIFKGMYCSILISFAAVFLTHTLHKKNGIHHKEGRKAYHRKYYNNIDNMEGHDFEYFCAGALKRNGFKHVEVTSGSGDYGIDITAYYNGLKYGIQCKRYNGSVGWRAVEEAVAGAVYWECDKAVVLTNSVFTRQAVEGASKVGALLWDRECLGRMADQ